MKTTAFCLITTLSFAVFGLFPAKTEAARLFSDVLPDSPYFESVSELQQRGILNGYSDGSFRPHENISRAAALKVILLSAGTEVTGVAVNDPFPDVPKDAWFAAIAKKGRDLGIVKGDASGNFIPARQVSRAEALAMLFRTDGQAPEAPSVPPFSDISTAAWYAGYFAESKNTGLLRTDPAEPDRYITRGELADLTFRFFRNDWSTSEMTGVASYYGGGFEGANTASGEKFSNAEFIAAHKTLPFGTRVRVTQEETLRSVVVRVVDRGPYVDGRVIDLSQAAFEVLAPLSSGVAKVKLEVVPETTPLGFPEDCVAELSRETIPADFFDGIRLLTEIPTEFRTGEVVTVRGELLSDPAPEKVTVFYGPESDRAIFTGTVSGKIFTVALSFPTSGRYSLSILPGDSGNAKGKDITVLTPPCIQNIGVDTSPPANLRYEVKNGETVFYWDDPINDLFRIEVEQARKSVDFFVHKETKLAPPPRQLATFTEGQAKVKIWSAKTEGNIFLRTTGWEYGGEMNVFLVKRISRNNNRLQNISLTDEFSVGKTITLSGKAESALSPIAYIIEPDENIIEQELHTDENGSFTLQFTPQKPGEHIFEVNQDDALTLFVGSSVLKGTAPLLPDYFDLAANEPKTDSAKLPETLLRFINKERVTRKLPEFILDEDLTNLAQFRADDMCDRGYFSHSDPEGKSAIDYRVLYNIQTVVGENIAKDTDLRAAHESLMRSPAHRKLIINDSFTRAGLGFCTDKDDSAVYTIVEIFGGEPYSEESIPKIREDMLREANTRRVEKPIVPNVVLEGVAQQWAQKMVEKKFWGFEHENDSLEKSLRTAGIKSAAQGIVLKIGSTSELNGAFVGDTVDIGETRETNYLIDTAYQKMGIGLAQNDAWEIYVVILAAS